jgi:serine/threonine protein phosphatase PrpC
VTVDSTTDRETNGPWIYCAADLAGPESRIIAGGQAVVYTHSSPSRSTGNQDSAALIPCHGSSATTSSSGMLVVADGAGGHAHGDRASSLAVTHIARALHEAQAAGDDLHPALLLSVEAVNREIMTQTDDGMTTLLVAELIDDTVRILHAGDSEALLIDEHGRVKHSTVPHSFVGYAVEAGMLDEVEAMTHHARHILFNALGMESHHIDLSPVLKLDPLDTLLLASDGLFDNLSTAEIVEIVRTGPLEPAVSQLVDQSRSRMLAGPADGRPGKPDDLTIVAWRPEA